MIKYLMIIWYILKCLRLRVNPSWFFQLNAGYFNSKKGIFSKFDINLLIPEQWRLNQCFYHTAKTPHKFPIFVKPEWGQNSYGIFRADSAGQLDGIHKIISHKKVPYLLQEAATEPREFEIFYVRRAHDSHNVGIISITEVVNTVESKLPINGIRNGDTSYIDRSSEFSTKALEKIWQHLSRIGHFRMARVGLKTASEWDLIAGKFHIVEINLFTPMPINLLDTSINLSKKVQFIQRCIGYLVDCTKEVSKQKSRESIFLRKARMHFKVKSILPESPRVTNSYQSNQGLTNGSEYSLEEALNIGDNPTIIPNSNEV